VALSALTLLSAALATAVTNSLSPPAKAKVGSIVEEFGGAVGAVLGVVTTAAHGMQLVGAVGTSMGQIENVVQDVNKTTKIVEGQLNLSHQLAGLQGQELLGANNLKDGNPCPDNEEELGGLCYEKCSDLTRGVYPVRSSAFSCCKQEPCNAFNSVFSNPMKFCKGLDVGRLGGGCPHSLGDCLLNEEFLLGFCYRKCALLTNMEYPYRTSADSCCRLNSYLACSDPSFTLTNATLLSVGGGQGDELLQLDAGQVHAPLLYAAEATTSTTLPPMPTLAPMLALQS